MRVLVTNDDGIHAPGLWRLAEALIDIAEIIVVAPDRDLSGVGASKTLLDVVRVNDFNPPINGVDAKCVQGTPSDCVILSTEVLFDKPFDFVISGVNAGANLGKEVLSSGTVGAAIQGFLRGVSSVAVSSAYTNYGPIRYEVAAWAAKCLINEIGSTSSDNAVLINLNVPDADLKDIRGVELTQLSPRAYTETVIKEEIGNRIHYWIRHNKLIDEEIQEGTDVWALRSNNISITSLDLNFGTTNDTGLLSKIKNNMNFGLTHL